MKILFIPLRKYLPHPTDGAFQLLYSFPYYVPSGDIFYNWESDQKIFDALVTIPNKGNIYKYFHLIPDDFFIQFEKIGLWGKGLKYQNSVTFKDFQYCFHKNGADIYTLDSYYQYQQGNPPIFISKTYDSNIIKTNSISFFAHNHNTMSYLYDGESGFSYIVNKKNNCIYKMQSWMPNNVQFLGMNVLLTSDITHSGYLNDIKITPDGKMLFLGRQKPKFKTLFDKRIPFNDISFRYGLIQETKILGSISELIQYQNSAILVGSASIWLPKEMKSIRTNMYVLLSPSWGQEYFTIQSFNFIWNYYIFPQNKRKIIKWVKKCATGDTPPLGFFEWQD